LRSISRGNRLFAASGFKNVGPGKPDVPRKLGGA
jgi:hypothetical protein